VPVDSRKAIRKSLGVTLASVDMSQDYQCERLLDVIASVQLLRDGLADHIERSRHDGDSLGTVGAVKLN
jgi:hypothetical protein